MNLINLIKPEDINNLPASVYTLPNIYLGSEKDIEDAVHVYQMFKENLDAKLLNDLIQNLNVKERAVEYGIG